MSVPKKIVVIGPESTGKSTLSAGLAAALGCLWVPEYARAYLERQANRYTEADMWPIAQGQLAAEDKAAAAGGAYLVCDTDLYVMKVWSTHVYGRTDDRILQEIAVRPYDLYLLCDIDMPWTADAQREYPEPEMRRYFFHVYHDIVQQSGRPWTLLRGTESERLAQALAALKTGDHRLV